MGLDLWGLEWGGSLGLFGLDWETSGPEPAGSDRHVLRDVAERLAGSKLFDGVYRARGVEARGRAADRSAIALVYQDGWDESPEWDDDEQTGAIRTVKFAIEIVVRDPRDEVREDRLGVLCDVASNLINHAPLAGIAIPRRTYLASARYQRPSPPEQAIRISGEAAYFVDSPSAHDDDDSDE